MPLDFLALDTCPHILTAKFGCYGVVLLDRPEALNALTPGMISALFDVLRQWRDHDAIRGVIIRARPNARAFCAGGDVRLACDMARNQDPKVYDFFRSEYLLNDLIHHYPKPIISFVDGIVMGGGAGIAMHCAIRIVTEKAIFAMPETAIGFVPDIGSSYFLNQCAKPFGLYLALTGDRIGAGDMCAAGFASDFIPSDQMELLFYEILYNDTNALYEILKLKCKNYPTSVMFSTMPDWQDCFMARDLVAVVQACAENESMNRIHDLLKARCPTSLAVTFAMMRGMRGNDLRACLQTEFIIISNMLRRSDFFEGVRAVLVDKTHDPVWSPADLSTINMGEVIAIMDDTDVPPIVFREKRIVS